MKHVIDWNRQARLVRAQNVTQFGDGYRQLVGTTTLAEGSVDEVIERAGELTPSELYKAYIIVEGSPPLTIEEVEEQRP